MSISLRKLAARLIAAVMTVSAVTAANAAALEQPVAVLSSSLNASVGTVLTSDEVTTAAKAYSRAKADAAAQAKVAAAAKAEADAKAAAQAKADAEAKKKAEEEAKKAATLITAPVAARSVSYSAEYLATDAIKANATALGSYKLTFYCPCEICNGALFTPEQLANGFVTSVVLLVGLGTVIHSMLDYSISILIWKPVSLAVPRSTQA